MSLPQTFTQQTDTKVGIRQQLVPSIMLFVVGTIMFAVLARLIEPLRPFALIIGLVLAAAVTAGMVGMRMSMLRSAAGSGTLTVDERGLVAEYGGSTRTLAWGDIQHHGPVAHPAFNAKRVGGSDLEALTRGATNVGGGLAAPKTQGVVGPGTWTETQEATLVAKKLRLDWALRNPDQQGRPQVPIWLSDYGPEAERTLGAIVAQHRPDLAQQR